MGGQSFDIGMFKDTQALRKSISAVKKNMFAEGHAPVVGVREEDHRTVRRSQYGRTRLRGLADRFTSRSMAEASASEGWRTKRRIVGCFARSLASSLSM
jgi:hypothetical protein